MLAAKASAKSEFKPNCQKTWTRAMQKGGFVLKMVILVLCVGFWVLTLNWELNNDNLNCLNPHTQGTMGCWSRAKVAVTSVTD